VKKEATFLSATVYISKMLLLYAKVIDDDSTPEGTISVGGRISQWNIRQYRVANYSIFILYCQLICKPLDI